MRKIIGKQVRKEGSSNRTYTVIQCQDCGALTFERKSKEIANALDRKCRSCSDPTKIHGHCSDSKRSSTYRSWDCMRQRCLNPNASRYERYGGRGITVCDEWSSFEQFVKDMGERPEGTSIDRIDNDKGYSPDNCRWSTPSEQASNRNPRKPS